MFQFPGFAFIPYVFRNKSFNQPKPMPTPRPLSGSRRSQRCRLEVGFPIRKYSDQSLFAAPQVLSQRTTSFIASQRQGIHRILLRHLIALIIDAPRSHSRGVKPQRCKHRDGRLGRRTIPQPSPTRATARTNKNQGLDPADPLCRRSALKTSCFEHTRGRSGQANRPQD